MAHVELKSVTKTYPNGAVAVNDLNLEIATGEFLCVLGPSGCGKSSTLRMIAGLEEISHGQILIDGQNVVGKPARERDIAMVFENYALYPHLNVFNNVAMPLVARRTDKQEINDRVTRIAEMLDITEHLEKRPGKLSGGQRQRVSLARAMIRRPAMFLMDEPLGHLEEYLRIELRREIRALHESTGGTTCYITHDQQEAAAVSDRIAVMSAGELQQVGTMHDLINKPVNRFVAEFVGETPISILEDVSFADGRLTIGDYAIGLNEQAAAACAATPPATVGIRPADFVLGDADATGLSAVAESVQPMGETAIVLCKTACGPATVLLDQVDLPSEGESVRLAVDPDNLHLFGPDGLNIMYQGS